MSDNLEYEDAIEKGKKLLQLLLADDTTSSLPAGVAQSSTKSIFNDVGDLKLHGYTGSRSDSCADNGVQAIKRLSSALKALGVSGEMACDGGKNFMVEHKHEETCTIGSIEYPVSGY